MVSYGSYALDYVVYRSTPVLTAYFAFGPIHIDIKEVEFPEVVATKPFKGSLHIGFQNVGPFPYMVINETLSGAGLWPPRFKALPLAPGRHENITKIPIPIECNLPGGMRVYNGTPPATAAEFTAPQGFKVAFDPRKGTLTVKYPSFSRVCKEEYNIVIDITEVKCFIVQEWRTALELPVKKGATQWWGWVKMINVPGPLSPFTINQTWYVMPAGPYVGWSGGFELFGVAPPFEVYSVYAAVNGSGLVVRIGDPNCGASERCIRTYFYPKPGGYQIDTGINAPAGVPVYVDQNYIIVITSTFCEPHCGASLNWQSPACATIGWYVPGVSQVILFIYVSRRTRAMEHRQRSIHLQDIYGRKPQHRGV
jgi:hypothetical protein